MKRKKTWHHGSFTNQSIENNAIDKKKKLHHFMDETIYLPPGIYLFISKMDSQQVEKVT